MTARSGSRWRRSSPVLFSAMIGYGGLAVLVASLLIASRHAWAQESSWTEPVMVSTNTVSSWWSDVAVDDWGQPHVVWTSGRPSGQGLMDLLMYSTLDDQVWLEPNDIALTAYGGFTVRPAIVADHAGTLHATFNGGGTIYYTSSPVSEAWNAASWKPRRQVSGAAAGATYYSDVAVEESGVIHVVYNESVATGIGARWLWFGTSDGGAVHDGLSWRNLKVLEEVLGRAIYAVAEDEAGVQWFGTDQGVFRFDGGTLQRFTAVDGLADNKVNCIAQDKDGRLWFGTEAGVSAYDQEADEGVAQWTTYTVSSGLPHNTVNAAALDALGNVWVGTEEGLARYDGQSWLIFGARARLAAARVLTIAGDPKGGVWVGTQEGVYHYVGRRWTHYIAEDGLLGNVVRAIAVGSNGEIWFGTDKGLSRFDGAEWTSFTGSEGIGQGAVMALAVDSGGTVWVGTETGVSRYDGAAWEAFQLPQALVGQPVTSIAEDRRVNAICPLCEDIFYRHSTDEGRTWSAPINLSNSFAGSAKPQVRVGSGGRVYVVWEEYASAPSWGGIAIASMYAYSPDRGRTWADPVSLSPSMGAVQQPAIGVDKRGGIVVVWRLPDQNPFFYQTSTDNGATWSGPEPIPGVIAKPVLGYNLDGYDAAADSAGRIHLLLVGRLSSADEDLAVIHLVWNGSEWSSPTRIFASNDPPEWPRIDVGAGNKIYATWFTRDERHIWDSAQGRYKVWVSSYQARAPVQTPAPLPTQTRPPGSIDLGQLALTATPTPAVIIAPESSGLPARLDTESDDIARLILALSPIAVVLLVIAAIRFSGSRRHR